MIPTKDRNRKPWSFRFRFCTLPNLIRNDQPTWVYADDKVKVNQYPTPDKKIKSKANTAHAKFSARLKTWQRLLKDQGADDFLEEADDFSDTRGPAGENEELDAFSHLFFPNNKRQSIWKDTEEFESRRLACDPRLEENAKKCYEDAFVNGVFVDKFCSHIPNFAGFTLNDVHLRKEINLINRFFGHFILPVCAFGLEILVCE